MKAFRLMQLIGQVEEQYIEASCQKPSVKRRANPWPYLIAAVLALAVIGGGAAFLRYGDNLANRPAAAESAPAEAPAEAAEGAEAAEAEEAAETAEDKQDAVSDSGDPRAAEYLENLSIGGLYLGMPESDVLAVLGSPDDTSNSGPVTYEDGITRVSWVYWNRMGIELADAGDGYALNEIHVSSESDLTLPEGVGIGSTQADVEAMGLPFQVEHSIAYTYDENDQEKEIHCVHYSLYAGDRYLTISLEDGIVTDVNYGSYYPDPVIDWDDDSYEAPYDMNGDLITVYFRQDGTWQSVDLGGKDAKYICVLMNIEDLQPYDGDGQAQYVIDFHRGTVAALYGPDESGAVYTCPEGVTFSRELLEQDGLAALTCYQVCFFPSGTWEEVAARTAES